MPRAKRNHSHFDVAVTRCAAMQAIDTNLDMGFGLTVPNYQTEIESFRTNLNAYNTALSQIDAQATALKEQERRLQKLSTRMLSAAAGIFGRDSLEYQKAGGSKLGAPRKSPSKGTSEGM